MHRRAAAVAAVLPRAGKAPAPAAAGAGRADGERPGSPAAAAPPPVPIAIAFPILHAAPFLETVGAAAVPGRREVGRRPQIPIGRMEAVA